MRYKYGMNKTPKKSLHERWIDAEARGCKYLADANEAQESGKRELAEKLYDKGQFWLDRANQLELKVFLQRHKA
jgi:hypothetical protein